jgi:hypothetical protein
MRVAARLKDLAVQEMKAMEEDRESGMCSLQ